MKRDFIVLGGMAGSSMDGLDLALIRFYQSKETWNYESIKLETIDYPQHIFKELRESPHKSIKLQKALDISYGHWISEKINHFLIDQKKPIICAIHGHTVIHAPVKKISWQLGNGQVIADKTGIATVTNFRDKDIALGGQGAPLVPFGDFHLFKEYDACLNLGGIANLSIEVSQKAGDICPCNQVLNYYAGKLGLPFDESGNQASKGQIDDIFLKELENISFFKQSFPKSLPNHFIPTSLLDTLSPVDGLRTYSEFIASQIFRALKTENTSRPTVLITGGGAFNTFLISRIATFLPKWQVIVPSEDLVSYKEAIIFAFLGLMKKLERVNVLSTVTGARADSSSGVIHLPK